MPFCVSYVCCSFVRLSITYRNNRKLEYETVISRQDFFSEHMTTIKIETSKYKILHIRYVGYLYSYLVIFIIFSKLIVVRNPRSVQVRIERTDRAAFYLNVFCFDKIKNMVSLYLFYLCAAIASISSIPGKHKYRENDLAK